LADEESFEFGDTVYHFFLAFLYSSSDQCCLWNRDSSVAMVSIKAFGINFRSATI